MVAKCMGGKINVLQNVWAAECPGGKMSVTKMLGSIMSGGPMSEGNMLGCQILENPSVVYENKVDVFIN